MGSVVALSYVRSSGRPHPSTLRVLLPSSLSSYTYIVRFPRSISRPNSLYGSSCRLRTTAPTDRTNNIMNTDWRAYKKRAEKTNKRTKFVVLGTGGGFRKYEILSETTFERETRTPPGSLIIASDIRARTLSGIRSRFHFGFESDSPRLSRFVSVFFTGPGRYYIIYYVKHRVVVVSSGTVTVLTQGAGDPTSPLRCETLILYAGSSVKLVTKYPCLFGLYTLIYLR